MQFTKLNSINQSERNTDLSQTSIISMLCDNIDRVIKDYYDEKREYNLFDASVLNIVKPEYQGWGTHDITVQVYTFSGAHNPPYATEIMVFRISLDSDPLLIEYRHEDN